MKGLYIVEKKDSFESRWKQDTQFDDFYEAVNEAVEISKRYTRFGVRVRVFDVGLQMVVMTLDKRIRYE